MSSSPYKDDSYEMLLTFSCLGDAWVPEIPIARRPHNALDGTDEELLRTLKTWLVLWMKAIDRAGVYAGPVFRPMHGSAIS